jgi:hypothetical protein
MTSSTEKFVLILCFVLIGSSPASAQKVEKVKGRPMYTVLPFDAIPAIDRPAFVDAKRGDVFMHSREMVIGVVVDGEARAYSAWHLDHHEIVNDRISGKPIAVTW